MIWGGSGECVLTQLIYSCHSFRPDRSVCPCRRDRRAAIPNSGQVIQMMDGNNRKSDSAPSSLARDVGNVHAAVERLFRRYRKPQAQRLFIWNCVAKVRNLRMQQTA